VSFVRQASIPTGRDFVIWLSRWNSDWDRDFRSEWELTKREMVAGLEIVQSVGQPQAAVRAMTQFGCFRPETKGAGTGTVLAALAVVQALGDNLREAVLFAVNSLGSDTDTIAGFVGAMIGGAQGYGAIPPEWASSLQDYDYFMRVATELTRISSRTGVGTRALLPVRSPSRSDVPDLVRRLSSEAAAKGQRIGGFRVGEFRHRSDLQVSLHHSTSYAVGTLSRPEE